VIPIPRPVLSFFPPARIQLHGKAELLNRDDAAATAVFESFWLGRRILRGYQQARDQGEARVFFIKIVPEPQVRTYMVGSRLWELGRNMEAGSVKVALTSDV
jgi:hypothetical protein